MHNYTIQDYFMHERVSLDKNEYFKGTILAMPGTTDNHSLISGNFFFNLRNCTKNSNKNCYIYTNDVRFYIPLCKISTYPDIMIVCGEPKYYKGQENYVIINPNLIVEVLSKNTERYDRETKLPCYLTSDTVETVILIDQYKKHIEVYHKNQTSKPKTYNKGKFTVMDCEIDIDEVYEKVKFVN